MKALLHPILDSLAKGEPVMLATVLRRHGSAPRGAGACMLVWRDGHSLGTIGGGAVERQAWELCIDCLQKEHSSLAFYQLSPNEAADIGMVCGGEIEVHCWLLSPASLSLRAVFAELSERMRLGRDAWLVRKMAPNGEVLAACVYPGSSSGDMQEIAPEELLPLLSHRPVLTAGEKRLFIEPMHFCGNAYVFGGGHIAQELVPLLARLEFSPIVFDDREEFTEAALFPTATQIILGDFSDISRHVSLGASDYAVIMTRGHRYDSELLTQILRTNAFYIGLIGSRSKITHTKKQLMAQGFGEEAFLRVHTPIGLPIRAQTPAEIAVSIAAEMILRRNSRE